ncbi:hypothetical protein EDD18DRAFT_1110545 [Armillaria luteobubalina]|uniref:RRM domain-containing protein n=1 Tax=Armillaria luteobubalina TaxID=153913 RepID=A0AA39PQI4_9AGAR|nr:hypothetical protein EDD18DRAFT_1110545 [Armillaria luteobubalina]
MPIPPTRAPPSPPESVVSSSTGSLNPNAGNFVPSSLPDSRYKIHSNSPSSASVHSSPGSSSTSTSVSFTLAPSISTFASFSSNPSRSEITFSTTQSSFSSYHSPFGSPSQIAHSYEYRDGQEEAETGSSASEDAGTLLRSLHLELGEVADVTPLPRRGDCASPSALPSSPEVVPSAPSKKATYIPLLDIEILQAAPSSFMSSATATSGNWTPAPSDKSDGGDPYDDSNKTPNVYINGLPPNYPEDQQASGVSQGMQGRKRVDMIRNDERRGKMYPVFETFQESASDILEASSAVQGDDSPFKAKMERLHDPNSTNLYIEGIKSSRFFQTRLSNPPRIIAFVRLDTRVGAEEVIERLHGRMCTERSVKEDDQCPSRLTIAQAALLNLHGREQLRSQQTWVPLTVGGSRIHPSPFDVATFVNPPFRDFSSNAAIPAGFGYRGNGIPIVSNPALASSRLPISACDLQQSPYDQLSSAAQSQGGYTVHILQKVPITIGDRVIQNSL